MTNKDDDNIIKFTPPPERELAQLWAVHDPYSIVIVEGREIPLLKAYEKPDSDEVVIVLDGRFSLDTNKKEMQQWLWLMANAIAIGQGYSHVGAESKDQPFAPQVHTLTELPK
jgi:hypothetical protein